MKYVREVVSLLFLAATNGDRQTNTFTKTMCKVALDEWYVVVCVNVCAVRNALVCAYTDAQSRGGGVVCAIVVNV